MTNSTPVHSTLRHRFSFFWNYSTTAAMEKSSLNKRNATNEVRQALVVCFWDNNIKMVVWIRVQFLQQWSFFHSKAPKSSTFGEPRELPSLIRAYAWTSTQRRGIRVENPSTLKKMSLSKATTISTTTFFYLRGISLLRSYLLKVLAPFLTFPNFIMGSEFLGQST